MAVEEQAELHNALVGPLVASIVKPIMETGGGTTDILLLVESVVTGVILYLTHHHGPDCTCHDTIVDLMAGGIKVRLAEIASRGATKQ